VQSVALLCFPSIDVLAHVAGTIAVLSATLCLDDGRGNNLEHPEWGSVNQPRVRVVPKPLQRQDQSAAATADAALPSARRVMEGVFHAARPTADKTTSHVLLEFGHFIVQDILGSTTNQSEPFDVPCDGNLTDYVFCPATGKRYFINASANAIPFYRQSHVDIQDLSPTTSSSSSTTATTTIETRRASINGMTSYLDLSNLYGTTTDQVEERRGPRGSLRLDEDGIVPRSNYNHISAMNKSVGLFAIYVAFMRYHNYLARQISEKSNTLTDDEIFEQARQRTIAVYQSFVEEKYVPTLLGKPLEPYVGYDPSVDPSIDEYFAALSFRYAHTSLSNLVRIVDENYQPTPEDPLLLRETFHQNMSDGHDILSIIERVGQNRIEPFLRGLTVTPAKGFDASFVDDLNFWTEATSVIDIQRSRDVGIPSYNDVRRGMGLPPMASFEELLGHGSSANDDETLLQNLKELYHDDIDLLDAYVGALVEPKESKLDSMTPLFMLSLTGKHSVYFVWELL
jgi:hypothetical protein